MPAPIVYLDECVDTELAEALRKRGFSVSSAADEGLAEQEIKDAAQLAYAAERGWVLITHNEKHFRRLHGEYQQRGQPHAGIIFLPGKPPFERLEVRAAMMLDWIAPLPEPRFDFFVWGRFQEILERGHVPAGYSRDDVLLVLGR